ETMPTPVDSSSPYRQWETLMSDSIASTLELAGTTRDSVFEMAFGTLYAGPWAGMAWVKTSND
ncbi:hypothetical protein SAMN02745148_03620, partial [Modicisalibacter ilicicola DSM 19980]